MLQFQSNFFTYFNGNCFFITVLATLVKVNHIVLIIVINCLIRTNKTYNFDTSHSSAKYTRTVYNEKQKKYTLKEFRDNMLLWLHRILRFCGHGDSAGIHTGFSVGMRWYGDWKTIPTAAL